MKRESEASAEETTQDEDEPSEVSPSKKTPRKANRPRFVMIKFATEVKNYYWAVLYIPLYLS